MRHVASISIALLWTITPIAARADMAGPLDAGVWMSTLNIDPISITLCGNGMIPVGAGCPGPRTGVDAPPGGGRAAAVPTVDPVALRFTPSTARRKVNLAHFVEKTRKKDPAGAQQLSQLFLSGDIIGRMGQELAPVGLRTDNLADAYTVWWINCWSAVHSDPSTPDRATVEAVRAQVSRALLSSAGMASATDPAKQEFSEALLIQALLLDASVQQSRGNPAQLKAVATAANQGARGMGIDMTTMRLTPKGFMPMR